VWGGLEDSRGHDRRPAEVVPAVSVDDTIGPATLAPFSDPPKGTISHTHTCHTL
jgi:hypothetical protein